MRNMQMLDVSYNKLVGVIPDDIRDRSLKFLFVTRNMLSGVIPSSILKDGRNIDLSYNNFTWQDPEQPVCRKNMNWYINLFKSFSTDNILRGFLPCEEDVTCPKYKCSLHVNCGGPDVTIKESNKKVAYEGDEEVDGGTARYFSNNNRWGFSSTGDFMDDDNYQNTRYTETVPSKNIVNLNSIVNAELYSTARLSPLSLTYFHYCLENGVYNISLHFAEILFTNDNTSSSLGRRLFDIYIQEILVKKDFNIEDEAHGVYRALVVHFNASVTNNILEIRFYWAGKGTTRIPGRGEYGPLISAISVDPYFKSCSSAGKKKATVYVTVGAVVLCLILLFSSILCWKCRAKRRKRKQKDFEGLEMKTVSFTLKQIKAATNNFDSANKIGEGGFGPVYKGVLSDGTVVAVKQLSSTSRQGNREFLTEISMISCLHHPNLVNLHGCCIEGDQLLLVYEYMENNSLGKVLSENSQLTLDWPTRLKICIGIARGLAFLHEESNLKIVHRDIKATNILLDRGLNPKISDFGLAKLNDDDKTHISTRVAGTIGYMAPEYAMWGHLTYKADVYSFGVVVLEIVSGKNNNSYMPKGNYICLLDWACQLQQSGNFIELVDEKLSCEVKKEEAERVVKVGLLCTNVSPSLRPTMSEVVSMLEGKMPIPEENLINESTSDLRFKAVRDFYQEKTITATQMQEQHTTIHTKIESSSSTSTDEHFKIVSDEVQDTQERLPCS